MDRQGAREEPGFLLAGALQRVPLSTPVSGELAEIYLCFPSFFISTLQRWRSPSAGCPCHCHVGSICCDGQRGLIAAGSPVRGDRMSLRLIHCLCRGTRPSNLHKPFSILVHFLDIATFPRGSNISTSFVLGAQKHCPMLSPLPGKTDLTFRNFYLIFFLF